MTDFDAFNIGGVRYPLSTTSEAGLLRDADPALYYAIDFWVYVIQTYVGTRLVQELNNAGVVWANRPIEQPVAQWYSYEPLPEQLENQFQFPLFAAYRTEAQTVWETVGYEADSCALEVLYILPPLDAAQSERILPIFHAIAGALRKKTTDAWDPGYTPPGGSPGEQFCSEPYGNVEEIGFGQDRYPAKNLALFYSIGFLPSGQQSNLYFPTLKMRAYVRERDMYGTGPSVDGVSKLAGVDITGNVQADDGTRVLASATNVVQAATQGPPTIASLSVTSGPAAGGTNFTLRGSLFLAGPPTVYFGPASNPQYAASVAFVSAAQITVTTPAMQGSGTVDVTAVNRDGQSATAPQSFTFV